MAATITVATSYTTSGGTIGGTISAKFVEVESGQKRDRSQLAACRVILVIAKPNRLARNVASVSNLIPG